MAASYLCAATRRCAGLATLAPSPLTVTRPPLMQLLEPLARGAAGFSSSSGSATAAAAPGGGSSGPDAFTAALQQKTEEELRRLALRQAQPHAAHEGSAPAGEDQEGQQPDGQQPPHAKREIGGYKGPEPTRYSRSGASDWEIKGRCTDF